MEESKERSGPLITVIVPVYNILLYLERCVESIKNQTYKNLEIILVDDGSNDGTEKLCDSLAGTDSRIKVIHKQNGGSSSARNVALKEAKGDYIGFIDSDDYISPDMYEKLLDALANTKLNIAQCGRDEIDEQGNRLEDICTPPAETRIYSSELFLEELLMHRGDCSFCTKLFKREVLDQREFPVGKLNEDFRLLVDILSCGESIVSIPGQYYHVFYRLGSNSRKVDKEAFSRVYGDCVENADYVEKLVLTNFPVLSKVAFRFGSYQREQYLLHIPISQMLHTNGLYCDIKIWIRKNIFRIATNPILTNKDKLYLILFAIAPKFVRILHKKIKRL